MPLLVLLCAMAVLPGCVMLSDVTVSQSVESGKGIGSHMATGFIDKTLKQGDKAFPYAVYVPRDYNKEKEWPLVVFLHGAGERGNDGLIQTNEGIGPAIRKNPERFPAVVLFPQCPKDSAWISVPAMLDDVIERTRKEYRIDEKRIYLTGLSMGGYGTWIWGAVHTDLFAAMIPICGGGKTDDLKHLNKEQVTKDYGTLEDRVARLVSVPIWAFHGAADDVVPPARSREMVELLRAAGSSIQYTEYPGVNHNSWSATYADEAVVRWMFSQKKK